MESPRATLSYRFWRSVLRLFFSAFCRLTVLRKETGESGGPIILAANHISHFDPPLLSIATGRQIDWMAMEELFSSPVFGFLLRTVGAFPVRRGKPDRVAVRMAVRRLEQGRVVGIFPEGGIRDGASSVLEGAPVRPGLSLVAALSRAPVLPAVILGSDRLYNKKRWLPFRRTPVWVAFGSPLEMAEDSADGRAKLEKDLLAAFRCLRDEMLDRFGLDESDLPHPPASRLAE